MYGQAYSTVQGAYPSYTQQSYPYTQTENNVVSTLSSDIASKYLSLLTDQLLELRICFERRFPERLVLIS